MATKPVTPVQDAVSTFASVTRLDVFKATRVIFHQCSWGEGTEAGSKEVQIGCFVAVLSLIFVSHHCALPS